MDSDGGLPSVYDDDDEALKWLETPATSAPWNE